MSNNIIEIPDNDLGGAFRLKIERDTYGDFIATQEAGPPQRLMAQTWSQARSKARAMLYAIRGCIRSSQGLPYDLPADLAELADKAIPEMAKDVRPIALGTDEQDIPALLQRLLADMEVAFHQGVPEAMHKGIYDALQPALPELVVELIRRGMKRRFDACGMRYGCFVSGLDVCTFTPAVR
jgi:hypothetical protein